MKLINLFMAFLSMITSVFASERGSFEITTAFVEGYKNNVHMLSQQKNPRLFNMSLIIPLCLACKEILSNLILSLLIFFSKPII